MIAPPIRDMSPGFSFGWSVSTRMNRPRITISTRSTGTIAIATATPML